MRDLPWTELPDCHNIGDKPARVGRTRLVKAVRRIDGFRSAYRKRVRPTKLMATINALDEWPVTLPLLRELLQPPLI